MKNVTCFFTGAGHIAADRISDIIKRLDYEIENLINQGVTNFISGGEPGFDRIAASLIITKKNLRMDVRLTFALPCKTHAERWSLEQKQLYYNILAHADEIVYVSEKYTSGCVKKRNRYMVERSGYCVCALDGVSEKAAQAVRLARRMGVKIINVTD